MTVDDQTDPFDPAVAERFEVLDRLVPPPAPLPFEGGRPAEDAPLVAVASGPPGSSPSPSPSPSPSADRVRWRRPAIVAVAAAALVAVVGLSVAAGIGGDGDGVIEAGPAVAGDAADDPGTTVTSADADDGAPDDGEPLAVEVPDDDAGPWSSSGSTLPPTTATTTSATTGSTDPAGETSSSNGTTVPDRPASSTADTNGSGEVVTIAGLVTEVFRDCHSRLVLNESGEVVDGGPVSCDGGSHVVVDGIRIQTSSGYVAAEHAFDNHPAELRPGTSVVVTAVNEPDGRLTLNCDRCGIGR